MPAKVTSLRLPDETRSAIEVDARRTGRDFSSIANEMLAEGIRMRRVPGITFGDSPLGRVALIAGTGLGVFEVVKSSREVGGDWTRLRMAYHWLTELQLRAALAYAAAYPEEIERRLAEDAAATPDAIRRQHPFLAPASR
jgi:uncharacterized protein (DUF433 family)